MSGEQQLAAITSCAFFLYMAWAVWCNRRDKE